MLHGKESLCLTVNSDVKVLLKTWYRMRSYRFGEYGNDKENTGGSYWVAGAKGSVRYSVLNDSTSDIRR